MKPQITPSNSRPLHRRSGASKELRHEAADHFHFTVLTASAHDRFKGAAA